jgi:hypothetical protein
LAQGIMSHQQHHMHLAGFLIGGPVAHSHALWRNPVRAVPFLSLEYYVEIARILERGRFDLLFFADRLAIADRFGGDKTIGLRYGDQDATRMDPMPILGAPPEANLFPAPPGGRRGRPGAGTFSRAASPRGTVGDYPPTGGHPLCRITRSRF